MQQFPLQASASWPALRWTGVVTFEVGAVQPWRWLYDHELVCVLAGRGEIHVEGGVFAAAPNDLFLVQPGRRHSFRPGPQTSVTLLGIHFDWPSRPDSATTPLFWNEGEKVITEAVRTVSCIGAWDPQRRPHLSLKGQPRARALLEDAVRQHAHPEPEASLAATALLVAGLAAIAQAARLQQLAESHRVGPDAVRRCQKARDLLEAPCDEPMRMAELAARVGWSVDHLQRTFRAVFDDSPAAVQRAAQLRRARELLRIGVFSVSEVATQCGFKTASHFSAAFKSAHGWTPRQFMELDRPGSN